MSVISVPSSSETNNIESSANIILHEPGWRSFYAESPAGALSIKSFFFGTAHYTVGQSRFAVQDNVYLLLNHGQPYKIEIESHQEMESFCLFFSPGFVESVGQALGTSDSQLLDNLAKPVLKPLTFFEKTYPHDDVLSPALLQLRQIVSNHTPSQGWLDEAFHQIAEMLLQVQANVYKEVEALPAVRAATREELYRRLYLARDYADALYNTPLTLAELAQVACLSPNHLMRTFKQLFGQTPHQYIVTRRLTSAQRLLTETDYPITDICFAVGFESLGTFSWSFRRRFGLAPTEYRQQNR